MDADISRQAALAALREVEQTQARGMEARAYRHAAPFLILWGVAWMVGYGLMAVLPVERLWQMWLVVDAIGLAGSALLGRGMGEHAVGGGVAWRGLGAGAVIAVFIVATYALLRPTTIEQYETFPALVMAMVYSVIGLWTFRRFLWIGAAILVLTMVGFFVLQAWLVLWIGAVGGLALILGGLWLRKA